MEVLYAAILCGFVAVVYGLVTRSSILSASPGSAKMQEIALAIQEGAQAYLNRQYRTIAIVGVVVAVILFFAIGHFSALGFVIGAILSGMAGYIGMLISVRANVRTTEAAKNSLQAGLTMAFKSGAVTGMLVAGLALLSVAGLYTFLIGYMGTVPTDRLVIESLVSLGFGASLISIFARLGGVFSLKGLMSALILSVRLRLVSLKMTLETLR